MAWRKSISSYSKAIKFNVNFFCCLHLMFLIIVAIAVLAALAVTIGLIKVGLKRVLTMIVIWSVASWTVRLNIMMHFQKANKG